LYPTSIWVISSAIIKLSKTTVVQPVYRGVTGMTLPTIFKKKDEYGVIGGVELAFISATTDRTVAQNYAGKGGSEKKLGIVLEIQPGLVDRAADLSWISQYPFEQQVLFAPLTALEVVQRRIEDDIIVIEIQPTVNQCSSTIDEFLTAPRTMLKRLADRKLRALKGHLEKLELKKEVVDATLEQFQHLVDTSRGAYSVEDLHKNANFQLASKALDDAYGQVLQKYTRFDYGEEAVRDVLRKFAENEQEGTAKMSKFSGDMKELKTGRPVDAALGVNKYLGVLDKEIWSGMSKGTEAIRAEFASNGSAADKECMNYVLDGLAGTNTTPWKHAGNRQMDIFYDGTQGDERHDKGIAYFVDHPQARKAGLLKEHVVALRLYTTAAYAALNDPLRGFGARAPKAKGEPHPFPITVSFINDGIRKLRAVSANAEDKEQDRDFWRGMRNVELPPEFLVKGGTEFAPMSTSSKIDVALAYSDNAEKRLLFKVATSSFMERGADLQFLSAFPGEVEFLYPPLTYLQPTGKEELVSYEPKGTAPVEYRVIEVRPHI